MKLSKKMKNYFNAIYKQFGDKTHVSFCKREFKDLESVFITGIKVLENKKSNGGLIPDNRVTEEDFKSMLEVALLCNFISPEYILEIAKHKGWIKPEGKT